MHKRAAQGLFLQAVSCQVAAGKCDQLYRTLPSQQQCHVLPWLHSKLLEAMLWYRWGGRATTMPLTFLH